MALFGFYRHGRSPERHRDPRDRDWPEHRTRDWGERRYQADDPGSWNDRWQESYGPRAAEEGSFRRREEGTHGAYWSPERTDFSDYGQGRPSDYGAGQFRGKGPKGYRRSDERIREDVCECLTEDDYIDATNIEVHVKDCEVMLTGTVSSRQEKRRAEDIIERLTGVRDVHNQLRVSDATTQTGTGKTEPRPLDQPRH
jgi:hypothetical protein